MAVEAVVSMPTSMATPDQVPGSAADRPTDIVRYVTMPLQTLLRRTAVTVGSFAAVTAVLTGPALADVPQGWAPETHMSWGHLLLLILVIPVGLALVISLLVALPGLLRGEGVSGGHAEGQWLGGPRKGTSELAEPDDETSEAGGASARW
jgi:hypothetical protein